MSFKYRVYIFYAIWFIIVLSGPVTIFRNTSFSSIFSNEILFINILQRLTATVAFSLIFIQIILGSQMDRLVQLIGAKAYKIHISQGLVIYGLVLIHPLFENIIVYKVSKSLTDSLLVFIPSFETQREILLVFGRSAFLLATLAVIAAYFRTKPFFRRNWRAFHILNYLVFYSVFYHARIGSDLASQPFDSVYWLSLVLVSGTLVYRFIHPKIVKMKQKRAILEHNI
ncbi:MAG: hypothetical protein US60_C0003G0011 [Microgenomates group bacterium GW2011_GWC1_37_8]|uniref:Ferric oxidoreductase domain-containing protein n=1 Tax=Candidatus Woesebacteria bacterium GW2011_GWB1_38_8 TaxID=1618570 RepID=A0A0G0LCX2_9BACT|nr:MAG: hypothetical protein US60_C0003G0011 [Microgenomates group bacterium GW2011_GWC1_37_8]KKQ85740.1 MAG: hypothetical protein UT08_C0004G0052 [Candidatus Woesebacteria bacterium GW2011_GWB1_38_8]